MIKFSDAWWSAMTTPEPNTGCLLWLGYACPQGYGRVSLRGRTDVVTRAAYECAFGSFDPSLKVCHRCDTPLCVNPDHLFLGTQKANLDDMRAKGRDRQWGKGRKTTRVLVAKGPVSELLASEMSNTSVRIADPIHLIGTPSPAITYDSMPAPWRTVTGQPAKRPTCAIVPYNPPQKWTPERLAGLTAPADCPASGAMVQGASESFAAPVLRTRAER